MTREEVWVRFAAASLGGALADGCPAREGQARFAEFYAALADCMADEWAERFMRDPGSNPEGLGG